MKGTSDRTKPEHIAISLRWSSDRKKTTICFQLRETGGGGGGWSREKWPTDTMVQGIQYSSYFIEHLTVHWRWSHVHCIAILTTDFKLNGSVLQRCSYMIVFGIWYTTTKRIDRQVNWLPKLCQYIKYTEHPESFLIFNSSSITYCWLPITSKFTILFQIFQVMRTDAFIVIALQTLVCLHYQYGGDKRIHTG